MIYVIVPIEWMSARGIMPTGAMRKSSDGSEVVLHKDFFEAVARRDAEGATELGDVAEYAHNSRELEELLSSPEWADKSDDEPTESTDYVTVAAARSLMELTRSGIQSMKMSDKEKVAVADVYPEWSEGVAVAVGECYRCDGDLWEVRQAHTTQATWRPGATTLILWRKVDEYSHAGTADDPIPFEQGMDIEAGKYYSQYGVTYKAIQSAAAAVWNLKDIAAIVTPV